MPRLRRSIAFLATLLLFLAAGGAAASARVAAYDLTLELEPDARTMSVRGRIEVEGEGALSLHLAPFARDLEADAPAGPIETALATEPVTGQRAWRLDASGLEPGDELEIAYRLEIPPEAEGIALHVGAREGYLLSESAWYPVQLESLLPRPTPYLLRVRLPEGLAAAGGGTVEVEAGATTIRHAEPGRPFFAYGPYERFAEGALELWLPPTQAADAEALLAALEPAVDDIVGRYERWFGDACEAVRLVAVTRRGGWGAPCTLLLAEDTFEALAAAGDLSAGSYGFLAHELAHTWWGNRVVPAPPAYGLMVEGMANYLSALAVEARFGVDAAERMWRDWRFDAVRDEALAELTVLDDAYYTVAYAKGAWVHRMLADWIGEDAYLRALGELARDATRPELADVQRRLERASGLDLKRFFEDWVHGRSYPRYELDGAAGAWTLRNTGDAATPPLTLALDGERERVTVAPGASLELTAGTVEIDPSGRLLALPARVDAADRQLADEVMERLVAALDTGDPTRVTALFAEPDEAVATIADLAGELVIDDWRLESADDATPRTLTYRVDATIGGRALAGPLTLTVNDENALLAITSVRLNYLPEEP
jgi:hypothetical protein